MQYFLWMKYQSPTIECVNSQCFHGNDNIKINQKMKMIKDDFSNYNLIFIPNQYSVHWWIIIFVKLKNDLYSLDESYMLVTLDSMNGRKTNSILQVKNIL